MFQSYYDFHGNIVFLSIILSYFLPEYFEPDRHIEILLNNHTTRYKSNFSFGARDGINFLLGFPGIFGIMF